MVHKRRYKGFDYGARSHPDLELRAVPPVEEEPEEVAPPTEEESEEEELEEEPEHEEVE